MDEPGYAARKRLEEQYAHPHAAYAQPGVIADKDLLREQVELPDKSGATGYVEPGYRPVTEPAHEVPGEKPTALQGAVSAVGPPKGTEGAARLGMQTHLQFMCGASSRSGRTR